MRFVLKPIFSPWAIDSSVVPVLEHSFLNSLNSGLFIKYFDIGWSTETAKKEKPNKVSGLVVKHLTVLIGKFIIFDFRNLAKMVCPDSIVYDRGDFSDY